MEFLDAKNDCGQTLLHLVAGGSAILAELKRLSDHIPDVFLFEKQVNTGKKDKKNTEVQLEYITADGEQLDAATAKLHYYEQQKYSQILFDLSYIKQQDYYDDLIQNNVDLIELDEGFRESYLDIIERFFTLFESIYNYYQEVKTFVNNLNEGQFLEYSLESVLESSDGKQLLTEAFYQYGVMLLLLDRLIPSVARERIVVCYLRYKGNTGSDHTTAVSRLCKGTGYYYNKKTNQTIMPQGYPAEYFSRFSVDRNLVEVLINAMKDDDVYNQLSAYPNPEHRSVALANQGSMIFTMLPFCPKILEAQDAKMREICDKHYPDNWVIPIYQGHFVDINQYWEAYPAAKKALSNNLNAETVQKLAEYHMYMVSNTNERLKSYLVEGQLLEEFVLDHVKDLLNCLRDANVTIRWLNLHTHAVDPVYCKTIRGILDLKKIVELLLDLSKFEFTLKKMLTNIVTQKANIWESDAEKCVWYMNEISEYFAGNRNWGENNTDEQFAAWFGNVVEVIKTLDYKSATKTGRKIQNLIQALENVQGYEKVDLDVQIKHYITETQKALHHMVRVVSVKKQVLQHMASISDFSYAQITINDYMASMQATISQDPKSVLLLKTVFLKLASIMNQPLFRIFQANSEDSESVARYYSSELFNFVKKTLYVIPLNIFKELDQISRILSEDVIEFEVKIQKDHLKDYALFDKRFELAKKTHDISVLTEGMLVLDNVLMGVIEIEPKQILVDGLRKELCKTLAEMLHNGFLFNTEKKGDKAKMPVEDLETKFKKLKAKFTGLKRSIEYIQDFLNVPGEKIWREEFSKIIEFAVEKEATRLINKKYNANWLDLSDNTYIPKFKAVDENDATFMGRLLRNIIQQISRGFYLDATSSWYDLQGNQIFGLRYINFLHDYLGPTFLVGFDKLIVYNIVAEIRSFYKEYGLVIGGGSITQMLKEKARKENKQLCDGLASFDQMLNNNFESLSPNFVKSYNNLIKLVQPLQNTFLPVLQKIGMLQLLRKQVTKQIYFSAKVESAQYTSCLETLNKSMVRNIQEIRQNAMMTFVEREDPDLLNQTNLNQTSAPLSQQQQLLKLEYEGQAKKALQGMLKDMTTCVEQIGLVDPDKKVYQLTKQLQFMPLLFAVLSLSTCQSLTYQTALYSMVKKNKEGPMIDGPHYIVGMLTVFKQFNNVFYKKFLHYLSHHFKNVVYFNSMQKDAIKALPQEGYQALAFLDELCRFDHCSRSIVSQQLGSYVFDNYKATI